MATDQELLFALRREEPQALEAVIRAYSPYVSAVIEYQLGRNAARDFLRKRQLHTVAAEDYLTISDESAQRLLEQAERTAIVKAALDGLEQQTREVFLRYYYYNQPIREIALATGLSETAVKSRLLRGRKKLKEQLTEGGYLCED